jgi:hypothetical protein
VGQARTGRHFKSRHAQPTVDALGHAPHHGNGNPGSAAGEVPWIRGLSRIIPAWTCHHEVRRFKGTSTSTSLGAFDCFFGASRDRVLKRVIPLADNFTCAAAESGEVKSGANFGTAALIVGEG